MMKMRLLAVVLVILGAAGAVLAAEVINVDIQGNINSLPYVGNGAYNVGPNTVWIAYYGGWGVPVGSSRSEALVMSSDPPWYSSVYAAQVWIGDNGLIHGYYESGPGLMDDGFFAVGPNEPNIAIFGDGAYQGRYDIYVYGKDAGTFKLTRYGVTTTKTVSGDANAGQFELGHNYVVFSGVDINNTNSEDLYLTYTNKLNALQFVKQKSPFVIEPNSLGLIRIPAGNWDVAGERNVRTTEISSFGPDTWFDDGNGIGMIVGYLDSGEFMDYDITVDEANEGQYQISLGVLGGASGTIATDAMYIYLDSKLVHEVNLLTAAPQFAIGESTKATVNLYEGSHTVRWDLKRLPDGYNTGFSLVDVNFVRVGPTVISNCADVVNYGFTLTKDLSGNCVVDLADVALFVDNWLICNNPDRNGCF